MLRGFLSCFVLLLCYVDLVWHFDQLVGEESAGCIAIFFSLCELCAVCRGLFAFPICAIGRLCAVIIVLPGHISYYLSNTFTS